ncbi:MAG TPA: radical SAM protein [Spirochaetia bacterium]|nr:radical SAM protein [Spirochaetia bacterium]
MSPKLKRLCLILPKRAFWSRNPEITEALKESHRHLKAYSAPPLGLLTIAALTPADVEIELIIEDFGAVDYDKPYDMVGISAMTHTVQHAYEMAAQFQARGVYVVMGGIHATVASEEVSHHADTVIVGEAEELWPRFLQDYENGEPRKIYRNPDGYQINLALSPIPRYDLLKGKAAQGDPRYFYNVVPVQATRGCPHGCDFCVVTDIYGKKPRKKTIAQIRAEILSIKRELPNHIIGFADDNIFVDRRFARELLLEVEKLHIRWVGQSDVSIGERNDLLDLIYKSGCIFLLIGFESLDPQNLTGMNPNNWKLRQLERYEKNVRNIQEHGIIVLGSFITGLDNDDKGVFERVVDFMNRNKITGDLTFATPLPGSRLFERIKQEGRFLYPEPFWDRCTFFDVIFNMKKMTKREAEDGLTWAYGQIANEEAFKSRTEYFKEVYKRLA